MTLNFDHLATCRQLTEDELQRSAAPVIQRLRSIPAITEGNVDAAGIAIRGGSVYLDALDNAFTAGQLAAARCVLFGTDARIAVIESLECATIAD